MLLEAYGAFHPRTTEELRAAVQAWRQDAASAIVEYGVMDTWDVASVTDMSSLFYGSSVNEPIGSWSTGRVTTMEDMFSSASAFNQPIEDWNTCRVTTMKGMFRRSVFNQAISTWNTAAVTTTQLMFGDARVFNHAMGTWNTVLVVSMERMVSNARAFNQAIGTWNVVAVETMAGMFSRAVAFNNAIGSWNTAVVTVFNLTFLGASTFDQPIGTWNTAAVTTMDLMFRCASVFSQVIGTWNTMALTSFANIFHSAVAFNQTIGTWNIARVASMSNIFRRASVFNSAINSWNTVAVTLMRLTFSGAFTFNQAISTWNTAVAANMAYLFDDASSFNQAIGTWNTAAVTVMERIFNRASSFNQSVFTWNTASVTSMVHVFARASAFNQAIGTWNTVKVIDTYKMLCRASAFNQAISTWNTMAITSMELMLFHASAFNQAIGTWNTAAVENMYSMFEFALAFNQATSTWNTVTVADMESLFHRSTAFNQVIGTWNTAAVVDMSSMFFYASAFNQVVDSWNTAAVEDMAEILSFASAFNQAVNTWNTVTVLNVTGMFQYASSFNQDISRWNLKKVASMDLMFFYASACYSEFAPAEISDNATMHGMLMFSPVRLCPSHSYFLIDRKFLSALVVIACVCIFALRVEMLTFRYDLSKSPAMARLRGRSIIRDIVSLPFVDLTCDDPMASGRELHTRIAASRWCITNDDLDLFEHEVRLAWRHGMIPNGSGERANKFHEDPLVGPTMYQVNDYFIKPMTAMHGGVSFALLLHPEGLECDCFATHAWSEGVFEFCAKLRRGWPKQCSNMYVCFLANPQNLDITALLDVPIQNSPFAEALSNASHMIVVPNRFISIYSRLWCCYEAYLAYALNKTIVLPKGIIFVRWVLKRIVLCIIVLSCSILLAILIRDICCQSQNTQHIRSYCPLLPEDYSERYEDFGEFAIENMSIVLREHAGGLISGYERGAYNVTISGRGKIGQTLSLIAIGSTRLSSFEAEWNANTMEYRVDVSGYVRGGWTLYLCTWVIAENDDFKCWRTIVRMTLATAVYDAFLAFLIMTTKWRASKHIAASMAIGFHVYLSFCLYEYAGIFAMDRLLTSSAFLPTSMGSVFLACWIVHSLFEHRIEESRKEEVAEISFTRLTDANCSDENDKRKILAVLADRESEVDEALQTLMLQGMSTSELRNLGSSIHSSGYPKTGLFLVAVLIWPCYFFYLSAFGASFKLRNYFHRMHVLSIVPVIILYSLVWQAWLYYDADLGNVVVQAGVLAWVVAIVCGGVVGHWGVVGGVTYAACHVAYHQVHIQQSEFNRFLTSLLPVNITFIGFICWETLATLTFGSSCIHVLQEFFGISGCCALFGMVVRLACPASRFKRMAANGGVFVGCCCANCFLAAVNLANATRNTFFQADELPFHKLISFHGHYTFGIASLIAVGILCPMFLIRLRRLRSRSWPRLLGAEIEMQALQNPLPPRLSSDVEVG